jgi:hypothetical protein
VRRRIGHHAGRHRVAAPGHLARHVIAEPIGRLDAQRHAVRLGHLRGADHGRPRGKHDDEEGQPDEARDKGGRSEERGQPARAGLASRSSRRRASGDG